MCITVKSAYLHTANVGAYYPASNKGVLIADIYIRTTVYINLKNIPHSPEGTPGYRNRI